MLLSFPGITPGTAAAQATKVQGIIKSRSGEDIILTTTQGRNMIVLLTDSTDVGQVEGVLKARSKRMSMAALIPGSVAMNQELSQERAQNVCVSPEEARHSKAPRARSPLPQGKKATFVLFLFL